MRLRGTARLLFVFLALLALLAGPTAGAAQQPGQDQPGPIVIRAENRPLASLQAAAAAVRALPPPVTDYEVPNQFEEADTRSQLFITPLDRDPLLNAFNPTAPLVIDTQFDGSDNVDNGALVTPPDTIGEVSSDAVDRYVQMINIVTTVFDKDGVEQGGGAFFSSAFWLGVGGLCETTDRGDPIVLYDEAADRWLVSQFAFDIDGMTGNPAAPFLECIAVSQTSDPLGAYNRYAFDFSAIGLNDYPHLGFTTDDVGIIANIFTPPGFGFAGTFLGVIEKACLYNGTACTLIGSNIGATEFGFLPADLDDPSGTADVPALFGTAMTAANLFDIWEIVPDYVTPANTTINRIERVPIASFDFDVCTASRDRCIPHPGGGDDLETLAGRLMHRLQVRDFGSHLSMVASHTIDADAAAFGVPGRAGIRWYELRSTDGGANWSLHQEGTHAPADGLHRWMPSIAMNGAGEIGIGFMVSDATTPPEIRVSGQTPGGPAGELDAVEGTCRAGVAGADWTGRSGDYSATTVDPTRDTFWHTNEFGRSTAFRGWGTAVCEFDVLGPTGVYALDGFGGVHNAGAAMAMAPGTPYFGFNVARDMELASTGFYVLDGFGGLHAGGGASPLAPAPPYFGFDAAEDLELASVGGYVLDAFGGIHTVGGAPILSPGTPYFGFDAARDMELASTGFYVLDAFGGVHAGGGAPPMAPATPYFGFDITRDLELLSTGYRVLDGFGGVHAGGGAPAVVSGTPYFGFDVASDMEHGPVGFYVLDGFGGIHRGDGAPAIGAPNVPYFGFDISQDLEIQ